MMLLRVLTLVALGLAGSPSHGVEKELSFFDMALLSAYRYPGEGMEPSIHSGEFIYIDKIGFSASQIQPGNIVVFKQPGTSGTLTAKRAAALGGSTLQFRQWKLFVDDREIPEPYVDPKNVMSDFTFEWGPQTVPSNRVFVLADNRDSGVDSRRHGCVPTSEILGIVKYIAPASAPQKVRTAS